MRNFVAPIAAPVQRRDRYISRPTGSPRCFRKGRRGLHRPAGERVHTGSAVSGSPVAGNAARFVRDSKVGRSTTRRMGPAGFGRVQSGCSPVVGWPNRAARISVVSGRGVCAGSVGLTGCR